MDKRALIFGVTGQDGSYLAEFLLSKGYSVCGVCRRVSVPNTQRIHHLLNEPRFRLEFGDVTDMSSVSRIYNENLDGHYDEVYNLAAQSHVGLSFDEPAHTTQVTYLGCLNILETIRQRHYSRWMSEPCPNTKVRFYQASSSEMFGRGRSMDFSKMLTGGNVTESVMYHGSPNIWKEPDPNHNQDTGWVQHELTPMLPCSPYAVAKLAAHNLVRIYRESYGLFACSGILFNHESERRGENFVTRKITKYVASLKAGHVKTKLMLGNLTAKRDWGHAEDYVRGMWLMLQQDKADDYVLATGETHTVEDFLREAFAVIGIDDHKPYVAQSADYMRPNEVPFLLGDATKAKNCLGWVPQVNFADLVRRMVLSDVAETNNAKAS